MCIYVGIWLNLNIYVYIYHEVYEDLLQNKLNNFIYRKKQIVGENTESVNGTEIHLCM